MRLLKTSTYGVEQHTQFGTIFFVCVSFACSFFLCYYPILCPPARDQHAYTCLFSRVFLSRTAKKQYHDRLLMNVNRYFLRLLNDDISEKKTKKAWASTIMSNVTRRQGHRTLVAKQKKQTIYRKRQGWNSRNSKPSFLQLTRQPEPDDPQFILGNDGLVSFYADVIVSKLHFVVTSTACQIYERYYIERIYM